MKSDALASPAGQLFRTRRHESETDAGIETDVPGVLVIRDVLAIEREITEGREKLLREGEP